MRWSATSAASPARCSAREGIRLPTPGPREQPRQKRAKQADHLDSAQHSPFSSC